MPTIIKTKEKEYSVPTNDDWGFGTAPNSSIDCSNECDWIIVIANYPKEGTDTIIPAHRIIEIVQTNEEE